MHVEAFKMCKTKKKSLDDDDNDDDDDNYTGYLAE